MLSPERCSWTTLGVGPVRALALADGAVQDRILIRVTGIALPMVHGTDLPDAQEGFDGTDAVLIVPCTGRRSRADTGARVRVRAILMEEGEPLWR